MWIGNLALKQGLFIMYIATYVAMAAIVMSSAVTCMTTVNTCHSVNTAVSAEE